MKIISRSVEETHAAAFRLGEQLQPNSVLCFFGDLGSGKTTFIKGLVEGAAGIPSTYVNSPTFTYLNIYEGRQTLYHFDLYRLRDVDEFLSMGFEEYLTAGGICCIEWSERIELLLPEDCIQIVMSHGGGDLREISVIMR
jgi:tRNA threonylcarbamoyladenosine biosynthesis protein TsaE